VAGEKPIRVLDALCATGVRVRRWRNEIPANLQQRLRISANDLDEFALNWTRMSHITHPPEVIVNQEFEVSAPRKAAMGNLEEWLTIELRASGDLISFLERKLWPVYDELVEYMVSNELLYFSTLEARRYLYTFGILSKINK
jgi:hypothetical protein